MVGNSIRGNSFEADAISRYTSIRLLASPATVTRGSDASHREDPSTQRTLLSFMVSEIQHTTLHANTFRVRGFLFGYGYLSARGICRGKERSKTCRTCGRGEVMEVLLCLGRPKIGPLRPAPDRDRRSDLCLSRQGDTSHWLSNHAMICGRLSRPLYVGACD